MPTINVLIVEDHPNWQLILREKTGQAISATGAEPHILVVGDFETAWEALCHAGPWQLLISDIGLGGSKPAEKNLGTLLVEHAGNIDVPTIVVSGTISLSPGDVRDFLKEYKACDFFSKPRFSGQQFIHAVQSALVGGLPGQDPSPPHSQESPTSKTQSSDAPTFDPVQLRALLTPRLDMDELRTLCFELGIDADILAGAGLEAKIRELIIYCDRRTRLADLIATIHKLRPDIL